MIRALRNLARAARGRAACLAIGVFALASRAAATAPRDAIFYEYMPIAWRDSDNDAARFGDFGGMTAALPYLRSLGVTAVWMTPIFDSPAYHGYQHLPPNTINPRFGTEAQFLDFVRAAHADSIQVYIDLVAYMVSTRSTIFQQTYRQPASLLTDLLAYRDAHVANRSYDGGAFTTWNGDQVGYVRWNLQTPAAVDSLVAWTAHWLDPNGDGDPRDGVDGYRLDHVVLDEGWGYTLAFWQYWKTAMQRMNPQVFTFAEQGDWGSRGSEFLSAHDAAFTKPFLFAARRALAAENAGELYTEMGATLAALPAGRFALETLGDHDVDRLASVLGDDAGRLRSAAAVSLLQPLPPVIYFGDELGMRGTKAGYASDASDIPFREPFKWNAVDGPPMSNYVSLNGAAYAGRVARDRDGRSVEEQSGVSGSLLETYRGLAALRHAHAALRHGRYLPLSADASAVWAFARIAAGESVAVAINLSNRAFTTHLDLRELLGAAPGAALHDLVQNRDLPAADARNRSAYPVAVTAHGWAVIAVASIAPGRDSTTVDGASLPRDFARGTLLATQSRAAGADDDRRELDQLFARSDSSGLWLGVTGNVPLDGTGLVLLVQAGTTGGTTLRTAGFTAAPAGLRALDGLRLAGDFGPDAALWVHAAGGQLHAWQATWRGGLATARDLGAHAFGAREPLVDGLEVGLDDSNRAGVGATSADGAASAEHGCEWFVPWSALDASGLRGRVRVLALLVDADGRLGGHTLPALPDGVATLGAPPLSFDALGGPHDAAFTLGAASTPAVGVLTVAPSPARDAVTLRCEVTRADVVTVRVADVRGRVVRQFAAESWTLGPHALAWDLRDDAGRRVASGLYFVEARSSGGVRRARLAITR